MGDLIGGAHLEGDVLVAVVADVASERVVLREKRYEGSTGRGRGQRSGHAHTHRGGEEKRRGKDHGGGAESEKERGAQDGAKVLFF